MFWEIGDRINREVLGNKRATYGQQIVSQVAAQLQDEFGEKGFGVRSIHRMMQFAEYFPDNKIVSAVSTQLTWSHIVEILPLKDDLQREFYLTLASSERWSMRRLRKEIDRMLYERTAIATKPEELIKQELAELRDEGTMSPDLVFKSPYFLEFTGLKGMYSEESLEDVIRKLEPSLFERVTGLTIDDFDLLLRVGVFNRAQMNDAILKFRRYEDASLAYTGVNRHATDTRIGLMDSTVPVEALLMP